MPKTKVSAAERQRRKTASVNYNPIFPGDDSVRRKDNMKARVQHGDSEIKKRIKEDIEWENAKRLKD